jgi:ketosteroid isomerase-like protein
MNAILSCKSFARAAGFYLPRCGRTVLMFALVKWTAFAAHACAAPNHSENVAEHEQLRGLRDRLIAAVNSNNEGAIIAEMRPDVVLTMQDGQELRTIRGHDGVRDYLKRMLTGPSHGVENVQIKPVADDLSILYDADVAVAFGNSQDHYRLVDGREFDLRTRWTATVVKDNDRWSLAALQVSTNIFDNPVINGAVRLAAWTAVGAGVAGLILGLLIGRFICHAVSKASKS